MTVTHARAHRAAWTLGRHLIPEWTVESVCTMTPFPTKIAQRPLAGPFSLGLEPKNRDTATHLQLRVSLARSHQWRLKRLQRKGPRRRSSTQKPRFDPIRPTSNLQIAFCPSHTVRPLASKAKHVSVATFRRFGTSRATGESLVILFLETESTSIDRQGGRPAGALRFRPCSCGTPCLAPGSHAGRQDPIMVDTGPFASAVGQVVARLNRIRCVLRAVNRFRTLLRPSLEHLDFW